MLASRSGGHGSFSVKMDFINKNKKKNTDLSSRSTQHKLGTRKRDRVVLATSPVERHFVYNRLRLAPYTQHAYGCGERSFSCLSEGLSSRYDACWTNSASTLHPKAQSDALAGKASYTFRKG